MNTTEKPTPSPGHELCEKADQEASHFWCGLRHEWTTAFSEPSKSHPCGEFWQKPVKVVEPVDPPERITIEEYAHDLENRKKFLEKELAQTKEELAGARADIVFLDRRIDKDQKEIEELKSRPHQWPAPISTKDRLPMEKDANENGYVLVVSRRSPNVWLFRGWKHVNENCAMFWLTPPPIPQEEKVKDAGEQAWEEFCETKLWKHTENPNARIVFLAAFKAGKEAK